MPFNLLRVPFRPRPRLHPLNISAFPLVCLIHPVLSLARSPLLHFYSRCSPFYTRFHVFKTSTHSRTPCRPYRSCSRRARFLGVHTAGTHPNPPPPSRSPLAHAFATIKYHVITPCVSTLGASFDSTSPLTPPSRQKFRPRARQRSKIPLDTGTHALVTISPAVAPRKQIRRSSARLPKLSPPSGSLSLIKCSSRQESSTVAPRAPFPPLFASFLTHDLSVSFPPCVLHPLSSSHAHATPRSSPSTLSAHPLSAKILG